MLTELGELGQLPAPDLAQLWAQESPRPGSAAHPPAHDGAPFGDEPPWGQEPPGMEYGSPAGGEPARRWRKGGEWKGGRWRREEQRPPQPPLPRRPLTGRADHAARLLLSHMEFLEELSHEDHTLLCDQPAPHGALFVWLEGQLHEHGPQSWAVLREALAGHDCQALAERVMTGSHAQTEGDETELRAELRGLLNRMLIEAIKLQQNALIAAASQDPAAIERWLQQLSLSVLPRPAAPVPTPEPVAGLAAACAW